VEITKEDMKGFINTSDTRDSGSVIKPGNATCGTKGRFGILDTNK
jgi:hypothetical protein